MRKLIALLLLMATAAAFTASYRVIVASNNSALVFITLSGNGTALVPVPFDAEPAVAGGLSTITSDGLQVGIGPSNRATVAYSTLLLTTRLNGQYEFRLPLANASSSQVDVSLPDGYSVTATSPSGASVNGTRVLWLTSEPTVALRYQPPAPATPTPTPAPAQSPVASPPSFDLGLLALAVALLVVLIIVVVAYSLIKKK